MTALATERVFPAWAGMNRSETIKCLVCARFPRVGGDEPGPWKRTREESGRFPRVGGDEPRSSITELVNPLFSPRGRG